MFGKAFSILVSLSIILLGYSFSVNSVRYVSIKSKKVNFLRMGAWPGNRPPLPNMYILDQKMDAAWGRGKFRTEVWEDDVNPLNNWWKAYAPSEEEVDAADKGYNFKDPKSYFEVLVNCLFFHLIFQNLFF
jgi:hypothetical protein